MSIELQNQCRAETSCKTQDLHVFFVYRACAGGVGFVVGRCRLDVHFALHFNFSTSGTEIELHRLCDNKMKEILL